MSNASAVGRTNESSKDPPPRILVPVGESEAIRNVVAYAVKTATQRAQDRGDVATVHFVYAQTRRLADIDVEEQSKGHDFLDRVSVWAREDADTDEDGQPEMIAIETAIVGSEQYVFSPGDFARVIGGYARDQGIEDIIVDPEYAPGGQVPLLRPLESELRQAGFTVEEAPVERPARRELLVTEGTVGKYLAVFGASYLFYLVVGTVTAPFDLLTGAISAGVVTAFLAPVVFKFPITWRGWPRLVFWGVLYIPYLLWEIAKANVQLAIVILHPRLPIDPEMVEVEAQVYDELAMTGLANSITLTPGTLTVDIGERAMVVHTLTETAREGLLDGAFERAIRLVFYSRLAARIPSPRERMQVSDSEEITESPREPDSVDESEGES
ncbi:MAG: monovalent cation/H+ antiporter subunit E [Halorhabdus sp.]